MKKLSSPVYTALALLPLCFAPLALTGCLEDTVRTEEHCATRDELSGESLKNWILPEASDIHLCYVQEWQTAEVFITYTYPESTGGSIKEALQTILRSEEDEHYLVQDITETEESWMDRSNETARKHNVDFWDLPDTLDKPVLLVTRTYDSIQFYIDETQHKVYMYLSR